MPRIFFAVFHWKMLFGLPVKMPWGGPRAQNDVFRWSWCSRTIKKGICFLVFVATFLAILPLLAFAVENHFNQLSVAAAHSHFVFHKFAQNQNFCISECILSSKIVFICILWRDCWRVVIICFAACLQHLANQISSSFFKGSRIWSLCSQQVHLGATI